MSVLRITAAACILGISLAGCDKSGQPEAESAPAPAPVAPAGPEVAAPAPVAVAKGTEIPSALFKAAMVSTHGGGHCPISDFDPAIVSAKGVVKRGAKLQAFGWASDQQDKVPEVITLVLQGEKIFGFATSSAKLERKDVVATTGIADLLNSGYIVDLDLSQIPAGSYLLSVMQKTGDEQFLCDAGRRLDIVE